MKNNVLETLYIFLGLIAVAALIAAIAYFGIVLAPLLLIILIVLLLKSNKQ